MAELGERLKEALGSAYRVERELPGGGMSRVFLATEVRLSRQVVVKVLPPDMASAAQAERFTREIEVAASLQHPHIVPLLTAGSDGDLAWYVMPFVTGESLAARITRQGALPIQDAVRILRDVVDALAYSHANGIVHRDIKPANVMFSGKHALVTDFGVAKALSVLSGDGTGLTSVGITIGTPTYMAPEQAAADPHVDHRADLYAVGVMAYEMLTGRTPFLATTPQGMLAAHVTAFPDPITQHRDALPPALAAAVMKCLAKMPGDRWQSAEELGAVLESWGTSSGGRTPVPTSPHAAIRAEADRQLEQAHPFRVAGLFVAATVVVVATIFAATRVFGLPDWVWIGSAALMALGFPIVMYTGRVERKRARVKQTGELRFTDPPAHHEWFTWKRAITGGALALSALLVATVGYAVARNYGIGSAATLLSSGAIGSGDRFVLADFKNRTADSSLGTTVTEALRVDLGQSQVVRMLSDREVATALTRMTLTSGTSLSDSITLQLAQREGAKAIITGEIAPLGAGFVLTGRVLDAATGETKAAVRTTATDGAQLLAALNDLSGQLRERIGESLKSIRASDPLDRVTTASLEALQHYSTGSRIFFAGDQEGAVTHLRQAVAIDSTFAMAWRRLASALSNLGAPRSQVLEATRRAFEQRDRLTPLERALTEASYYRNVEPDLERSAAANRAALEIDSLNQIANNNLGLVLNMLERFDEAEVPLRRQLAHEKGATLYINLDIALTAQGKLAQADSLATDAARHLPAGDALPTWLRVTTANRTRNYAAADSLIRSVAGARLSPSQREGFEFARIAQSTGVGHHAAALDALEREAAGKATAHDTAQALELQSTRAWWLVFVRGDTAAARRELTGALRRYPLERIIPEDRPYQALASIYAGLRDAPAVQRLRREWETSVPVFERATWMPRWWDAREAAARGDLRQAIEGMREVRRLAPCARCMLYEEAGYWDRLGLPDSTEATLLRVVNSFPTDADAEDDVVFYAPSLRRVGELAEARGDRAAAREYYQRFIDVWRDADPEFQPQVAEAKRRLNALGSDAPRP